MAYVQAARATASGTHATPSTLKRKRSSSHDCDAVCSGDFNKKSKVLIDTSINRYHDHVAPAVDDKPYLLIRDEIKRALTRSDRSGADDDQKDALLTLFTLHPSDEYAPSRSVLIKHVDALASMANLTQKNPALVDAVLAMRWVGRDDEFVRSYIRLLGNLAATSIGYVRLVLQSLVDKFTQMRSSAGRLAGHVVVPRLQLLDRVHEGINHVLQAAPSALSTLQPILKASFPYHSDSLRVHTDFVSNLLRITQYEPSLKAEVMGLVVDRLMKIDAQTQGDIDDIEEEMGINLLEEVVTSLGKSKGTRQPVDEDDISDSGSDDEDDWPEESETDPTAQKLEEVKAAMAKMDAILELLFEHFDTLFSKQGSPEASAAFEQLLSIFSQTILQTRNSRHTQFLLFHFCQTDYRLLEQFATQLMTWTFNQRRSVLLRENAAMYLASLVSRGSRVSQELFDDVIDLLLHELERHRQMYEPNCKEGPDLGRWPTYYFIAQTLLYIFCFRWRNLLIDGEDLEDDQDIDPGADLQWRPDFKEILNRNIFSPLNPLKVCTPPIVEQFARIAYHLRFLYVFPLIEQNKRRPFLASTRVYDSNTASSSNETRVYQLEAWFPFDPYQLPRSKRWLEGDYIEYRDPPGLSNDEDEDDTTDRSRLEIEDADRDDNLQTDSETDEED